METLIIGVLSVLVITALIIERIYVLRNLGYYRGMRTKTREFALTITDKDDGQWKVLDEYGQLPGPRQILAAGDKVTWTLQSEDSQTAVELAFPSIVFDEIVSLEDSYHKVLKNGDSLELTVARNPPPGRYPYSVQIGTIDQKTGIFEGNYDVFVKGGSHVEIHVEWE